MNWSGMDMHRSEDYDDDSESEDVEVPAKQSSMLLFPVALLFVFILIITFTILPFVALCVCMLVNLHALLKVKFGRKVYAVYVISLGIALTLFFLIISLQMSPIALLATTPSVLIAPSANSSPAPTGSPVLGRSIMLLVDDFQPQPYQGETTYVFNRLEGDRGAINDSMVTWGRGKLTTTIAPGKSWGGVWMSLNHPAREGLPLNFSALLPRQILPKYQSRITGLAIQIAGGTPNRTFKVELKDGSALRWEQALMLTGGPQTVHFNLPALETVGQLVLVLDQANAGNTVVIERVSFAATTPITDTATAAFVWSYGMLLNNWNPTTGLVRDKSKDASGEFDAVQSTGSLAAVTAIAAQLGVVGHDDAVQIVNKISNALLVDTPRFHGLWPHWVKVTPSGSIRIVPGTEWSSVDSVIAAIALLDAQNAMGIDTSATEQMLHDIDWPDLVTPTGISHGYTYAGDLILYAWDTYGGESWLVELAYAGVTGQIAPLAYPLPPTANGSGFIDELAWLFVAPPSGRDHWGTNWPAYRATVAANQISYYPNHQPSSCFTTLGLFGLSAAEVPIPSMVPQQRMYQAFGVGGQFASANDGTALMQSPVVAPHYSAMIASLRPHEAIKMWGWLIDNGLFSPLNNVESALFMAGSPCDSKAMVSNQLKGSWNLSVQALVWGRYLAEQRGQTPILWHATTASRLLHKGYLLLAAAAQ